MNSKFIFTASLAAMMSVASLNIYGGSSNEELTSSTVSERQAALMALRSEKDISRLGNLMKEKSVSLRKASTFALREFTPGTDGHDQAKGILIEALKDDSSIIRFEAAQTLASWNVDDGNEVLIENLEHTNSLRRLRAAKGLYVTADKRAVKNLISRLRDPEYDIRVACINTLRKITGDFYNYNPTDPAHIALTTSQQKSLRAKYQELFTAETTASEEKLNRAQAAYNEACEEVMRTHIDKYSKIRDNAIREWQNWWIKNQDGKRIDWLQAGLTHSNPGTKKMAIESLVFENASESNQSITEALTDSDTNVVVAACEALAKFNKKESIPPLMSLLDETAPKKGEANDKDKNVKNFAAYKALQSITQSNFASLPVIWKDWWTLNEDRFEVGVTLPTRKGFSVRVLSTSGNKATFKVTYYYKTRKAWIEYEYETEVGKEVGIRNQKHVFEEDGLKFEHFFDMRTELYVHAIDGNTVKLKTADQEFTVNGKQEKIPGDIYTIRVK